MISCFCGLMALYHRLDTVKVHNYTSYFESVQPEVYSIRLQKNKSFIPQIKRWQVVGMPGLARACTSACVWQCTFPLARAGQSLHIYTRVAVYIPTCPGWPGPAHLHACGSEYFHMPGLARACTSACVWQCTFPLARAGQSLHIYTRVAVYIPTCPGWPGPAHLHACGSEHSHMPGLARACTSPRVWQYTFPHARAGQGLDHTGR